MVPVPPKTIRNNPAAIDAWLLTLSPLQRGEFANYLLSLASKLPPSIQDDLKSRAMARPPNLVRGLSGAPAAFSWGSFASNLSTGLIGAGVNIWAAREAAGTQQDIAAGQNATQIAIAQMSLDAQREMSEAMTGAQTQAVRDAASAAVATEQIRAQARSEFFSQYRIPIVIGSVLLLGGGAWMIMKRKRA
jgi:hypothetical protein